jgi:hypothetical protein
LAIGTSRRTSFAREASGWGAFFTTILTGGAPATTSLVLNGGGGPGFGTSYVTVGQKVAFLAANTTEIPKVVTAVSFAGGVPGANATITLATATTTTISTGDKVLVGWFADSALLLDTFSTKLNMNKWGPSPYSGSRAKYVSRRHGRTEADGSMMFMLRPSVNAPMIGHAVGFDYTTGSTPTLSGTTTSANVPGDVIVNSASTAAPGDIVQIGVGTTAECRRIVTHVTTVITLDFPLIYAHASGSAISKVVAPFLHTIPSATSILPSVALEDYIPYDNRTQTNPNGITNSAYYLPGAILKTLKVESQADTGVKVTLDFEAQDKIEIPIYTTLGIPSEAVYAFDQESVLINGTQNLRITENTLDLDNGLQKVFAKNNTSRAFCITAGQQEVKGTFKIYADQVNQDNFFSALSADTVLSFAWKISDVITGNYIQFACPQIVVSEFNDGDFNPGDLIYATLSFDAILDAGASNVNMTVTIQNSDYISY